MELGLTCGVTIATRNRREDLLVTCEVLARLNPPPDEVMICADGCTDGTSDIVRSRFPQFRVIENEVAIGSIASRNRMMRMSGSDIMVSLDDDSYPIETDFFATVKAIFAANPRLAVASFPQRTDENPETLTAATFGPGLAVGTYANSAAALRTAAFLAVGGYAEQFFHQYEEPDFGLRCIAAGYAVRFEPAVTVRHTYTGQQRNELRVHHLHARNELWSVMLRCPAVMLPFVAGFRVLRQLGYAAHRGLGWVVREPVWWLQFLRGLSRVMQDRQPVTRAAYVKWMRLVRHPAIPGRDR